MNPFNANTTIRTKHTHQNLTPSPNPHTRSASEATSPQNLTDKKAHLTASQNLTALIESWKVSRILRTKHTHQNLTAIKPPGYEA